MKKFNITGTCVPEEDYMVDISEKIAQIKKLVDNRSYFTINRARQYGKTTTLHELYKTLLDEYIVILISFQGLDDETFSSSENFCVKFTELIKRSLKTDNNAEIKNFNMLSDFITNICENQKIVLMIDEVDKTSNNRVFLNFLAVLRDKFLERKVKRDYTFHSVILAGVYDVKNIKLKMINEGLYTPKADENKIYNSPWNIAVNFTIDMSFNPENISKMLNTYEIDYKSGMDITAISEEIYNYTDGYPFLVSRICKCIDEELNKNWTLNGVRKAVKLILEEKNTLFDDIFKNLENNKNLYDYVYDLLILGEFKPYMIYDPIVETGVIYGFFKKSENGSERAAISNKIFELLMTDYYISKDLRNKSQITETFQNDIIKAGRFDMELCLRKFAVHYAEIFNEIDYKFYERHGRLIFLSYLKPLINSHGFYHIESQLTDLRRMDIVVDFGKEQFIIELKIWRGEIYEKESYEQLLGYMKSKNNNNGYILTFDFRKKSNKKYKAEWLKFDDKSIFEIIV